MKRKSVFLALTVLSFCFVIIGCGEKGTHKVAAGTALEQSAEASSEPTQAPESAHTPEPAEPAEPAHPSDIAPLPENQTDGNSDYFGKLRVVGNTLQGEKETGSGVQLKGISSHGLSWFPEYVNNESLEQFRMEWGCNVFRLAMYTAEYNGYCTGDEANRNRLKALIDSSVEKTEELNMYIIIDWHILSDGNPLTHKEEAISFFSEMAEKYKDKNHVIYEICNEPNGGTSWADIKQYANEVIPAIRQHSDGVILVGSPTWSQDIHLAAADPITGFENIMYTFHFYAATHRDELRNRMVNAVNDGLPVFVSEYGICDASGNGAIDEEEANRWLTAMNSNNISHVMWNLSNKQESSAMILSNCTKTSGFTAEDFSQSGQWFLNQVCDGSPVSLAKATTATVEEKSNNEKSAAEEGESISLANTWNSGTGNCYQYGGTINNTTGQPVSSWVYEIEFDNSFTIKDSWNGRYEIADKTLIISPMEYNSQIPADGHVADIGFILESVGELECVGQSFRLGS